MASLTLSPGRPGANAVTLAFDAPHPPREVRIAFADPVRGVEPIRLAAKPDGTLWRAGPVFLPHGGDWQATVDVLVSDFAQVTLGASVTVRDR